MNETLDVDVLVAGAGPTGLAAACALRLHGLSVCVADRAPGPAQTSRANFLHARGSEVLHRLGALGTLADESLSAMHITTYVGGQPMMTLQFGDPGKRTAAPPMVISQARVEAALRDRLAELGLTPLWGNGVAGMREFSDRVVVELDDGQQIRARWLLGCDGTASTVRALAGIRFPGVKLTERFLLADLHLDWDLDRGGTTGWVHRDGLVGAMPMPCADGRNDLWRLFAYDPGGSQKATDSEILERFGQILPERTGRQVRIGDPEWLSVFTVHRRLAQTYRRGRILLAGDATHAHAPFGGQGMLTGLGDAENLAFKLALVVRGLAQEAFIDTYEAERRPLATEVLRGTSAVTRLNVADSRLGRFLRDQVAVRIFNHTALQRYATYTASQLWVSYRKGPLGGRGGKPRPGDRVPDMPCQHFDDTPTQLHDELGRQWALLLPDSFRDHESDDLSMRTARQHLGEPLAVLRHAGDQMLLIRPDAHLAWRGSLHDSADLNRWLVTALCSGKARR
ncbi:FAD-dependent oxidoreductase [Mycobacteroides abscessus]